MPNADDMKGRARGRPAGSLTDDDDLKREGKADRATGKVRDVVDSVGDKVKGVLHLGTDPPQGDPAGRARREVTLPRSVPDRGHGRRLEARPPGVGGGDPAQHRPVRSDRVAPYRGRRVQLIAGDDRDGVLGQALARGGPGRRTSAGRRAGGGRRGRRRRAGRPRRQSGGSCPSPRTALGAPPRTPTSASTSKFHTPRLYDWAMATGRPPGSTTSTDPPTRRAGRSSSWSPSWCSSCSSPPRAAELTTPFALACGRCATTMPPSRAMTSPTT